MSSLQGFAQSRFNNEAWALLILLIVELLTNAFSEELTITHVAKAQQIIPHESIYGYWEALVLASLLVVAVLWLLDRRAWLRRAIFFVNGLFTVQLLLATLLLVLRLIQSVKISVSLLLVDAIIVFVTTILIFALWYWFIEVDDRNLASNGVERSWDLLFPQRQGDLPGYDQWKPRFLDYFFVAYTTSVAFSPTDTLPLSRAAKTLMMSQSAISLIVIVVVAGTAINILAGTA